MGEAVFWTLGLGYLLRAAYTAGVIKSWLAWEGKPYDAISIACAGATWPLVLWRGWRSNRGR